MPPRTVARLVRACAHRPATAAQVAERQQMVQQFQDGLASWAQTGDVFEPHTQYRVGARTRTQASGKDELAGWSPDFSDTSYGYFRTAGPPALAALSSPAGQPNPAEFR